MPRVLLCGICLIAIQTSAAAAQTLPSPSDNPVAARPAIDGVAKSASNVPEVVRQPDVPTQPRATSAPAAVLTPPTIDLQFLRAIRLDWDELGISRQRQGPPLSGQ